MKHNGTLVFALKVAITLAAFFLLARTLNWANVWSRVSATSWPSLCAAVGVSLIQIPLIGVRWGTIVARMLEGVGQAPRQRNLQRIVFSAQFVGQVLPVVAGDGLRMLMLREAGVPTAVAVKSTVLDRGFALAALFLVAVPGLAFSPLLMHTGALRATLLIVTVSSLCAGAVMLVLSRQIARALGSQPFLAEASKLLVEMRAIVLTPRYSIGVISLCLAVHALSVLVFMLLAHGQNVPLGWLDAAAVVPALLLATALPLSFAGWGVREMVAALLLGTAQVEPEAAVSLSVSFGFVALLASLPGAALILNPLRFGREKT